MAYYYTTLIDGSFDLEDINGRVSEAEGNQGPLLSIAVQKDGTNIASFSDVSMEQPPIPENQRTKLTLAQQPTAPAGTTVVFFGTINVASSPKTVLAYRPN